MAAQPTTKYQELIRQKIRQHKEKFSDRRRSQFAFICLISQDKGSKSYKDIPKWRNGRKVHAEVLLLDKLDEQYEAFCLEYGKPKVLIVYSWIVPCTNCTDRIICKLESARFAEIPERVVGYTTKGKSVPGCNEATTIEAFAATNIQLFPCTYHAKKLKK